MNVEQLILALERNRYDGALRALYGDGAIEEQRTRYMDAAKKFLILFGNTENVKLISTPGRTEICGNHTDHNHGLVAAAGVDMDIIAVAAANDTSVITVASSKYPEDVVDCAELSPTESDNSSSCGMIRGVAAAFNRMGYKIGGLYAYTDNRVLKGSGLSSSAAFEVEIGRVISELYNGGRVSPIELAKAGHIAETEFYGKPCGMLDQTACAVGSFVALDFEDSDKPIVESVPLDIDSMGLSLLVIDTGGNHADLTADYAAIPGEMFAVAHYFGKNSLREVDEADFVSSLFEMREKLSDRAVLRAFHYYAENKRVKRLLEAVRNSDTGEFLSCINAGGESSFMFNQNAYSPSNVKEQGISVAYALADYCLNKQHSAFRLQGGGFAGTLQVFVDRKIEQEFIDRCNSVFGCGSCHRLAIRNYGAVCLDDIVC